MSEHIVSLRIYFAIFFSIPWVTMARLTLVKGGVIFVGFLFTFSFAMYFRSNGFYSTPEMLLEYFLVEQLP